MKQYKRVFYASMSMISMIQYLSTFVCVILELPSPRSLYDNNIFALCSPEMKTFISIQL